MGAPTWPPNPQRSARPGRAAARLYFCPVLRPFFHMGAPTWPPNPNVRHAPAEPRRASISVPSLDRSFTWEPRHGPQTPNVRHAPAEPRRGSSSVPSLGCQSTIASVVDAVEEPLAGVLPGETTERAVVE